MNESKIDDKNLKMAILCKSLREYDSMDWSDRYARGDDYDAVEYENNKARQWVKLTFYEATSDVNSRERALCTSINHIRYLVADWINNDPVNRRLTRKKSVTDAQIKEAQLIAKRFMGQKHIPWMFSDPYLQEEMAITVVRGY